MPKKSKSAAEEPTDKKSKEEKLWPAMRMPSDLRRGDKIVVSLNRDDSVKKSVPIQQVERGATCRHYHVNRNACYHRHLPVFVAVSSADLDLGTEQSWHDLLDSIVKDEVPA